LAKKRYALWVVNDEGKDVDAVRFVGIDVVRSDTPDLAKHFLKKIYSMILKGVKIEEINDYVKDFIAKIRVVLPEEIALPTTIKKPLSEYKGNSIHVAGARYWNKYFYPKIIEGSKIKYLYVTVLNGNNYDQTYVISLPEGETLPQGFAIDYDKMIDRLVNMKIDEALKIYKQKDEKKFW
jgi:DNA polymerase elongation subunit (family B)